MWISKITFNDTFEIDELYHFINQRPRTETRENTYVIPLISRTPRQILSFDISHDKTARTIQGIVDNAPFAERYCTDGYSMYREVDFLGRHTWNCDKSNTHNIESVNADLRHYIPGLRRRSRIFYRSLTTLRAILSIFANAYNKFGEAKLKYRRKLIDTYGIGVKLHNWYKDPPMSIFDYL